MPKFDSIAEVSSLLHLLMPRSVLEVDQELG